MLINYSIYGVIDVNGVKVSSEYVVKNITTGFVSNTEVSEIGYYSLNLINYPNEAFNEDDIVVIEFNTYYNGINYKTTLYHLISSYITDTQLEARLVSNWDYDSSILSTLSNNVLNVKFLTTYYKNILFKLYIKYNNVYKEIDSVLLDKQEININLPNTGDYKIVGYVVDDIRLLSTTFKDVSVTTTSTTSVSKRYIEWE